MLCSAQSDSILEASSENDEFVYVLHGLGRTKFSMWLIASRLEEAGYRVIRIGYHSLKSTPEEILEDVTQKIDENMPDSCLTVNFVGHSMGGLMIRAYLDNNKVENLGRAVLIGPPNHGTTFVDKYRDTWWMKMMGPMTQALGTDEDSFPNSLNDPYYPVGIIAGVSDMFGNKSAIPGEDDGLVSLESTRLDRMTDRIIIETSHGMMRYNKEVAEQTIEFLRNGKFRK